MVARRGPLRIVENRQGLVMAAAGVDASNTLPGTVLLLPEDPDASARAIRESLRDALGVTVGVLVTDTFGRPWRTGLTDVAIGAAGVHVLDDLRGGTDAYGNPLSATVVATADELAAAGDLGQGQGRRPAGGRRARSCPPWWRPTTSTARARGPWSATPATTCSASARRRRCGRR
ncbi:Bifunctional F420 biosynthesis protein FbiB [Streptomyces hirsutus]